MRLSDDRKLREKLVITNSASRPQQQPNGQQLWQTFLNAV